MTTRQFVALEKRLLPKFPGFAIKGRLMFLTPLEHTLRGFSFEGSAFDKTSFYVTNFFMALCIPRRHLIFNLGERLRERGSDRWSANEENFETILRSEMGKQLLFLTQLKTPMDVVDAAVRRGNPKDPYRQETIAYMLAFAEQVKAAIQALDGLLAMLDTGVQWQHEMAIRARLLRSKLVDDPRSARAQLELWKKETLQSLSLIDHSEEWTPTC